MDFDADLATFVGDFGTAGHLDGQPVLGIYSAPTKVEPLGAYGGGGATASQPTYRLPSIQVPAQSYGLLLVLPQGNFTVREDEPDGTGFSLLKLSEAT